MTETSRTPEPASLPDRIEAAVEELVYSSEGDAPFMLVHWIGAGHDGVPDASTIAQLAGASEGELVEERALDEFLARHTERSDAYDTRAQAIRPRYEALEALLRTEVRDARFVRVGRQTVRCLVVGRDDADDLVGVETVAVET